MSDARRPASKSYACVGGKIANPPIANVQDPVLGATNVAVAADANPIRDETS